MIETDKDITGMAHPQLESCPFCCPPKAAAALVGGPNLWRVFAPCCKFYGPAFGTAEEATRAWNKRGIAAPLDEKSTIDLFEVIIGTDPQAFLHESVVYQVTQVELLKFAQTLVSKPGITGSPV